MITRRTKVQLLVFVLITLIGVSYVGARYARLDRFIYDDSYTVVAHFSESGGIFAGAEVSYRGVTVGNVEEMELTDDGVDVHLSIENDYDQIPSDTNALVGNRSAVGEQYVELQPNVDKGPYLDNDAEIELAKTSTPIATSKLLTDVSNTVESVDKKALQTVVTELGLAFEGTGEDLSQIIDTSNAFIETANDNFDVTRALIKDSNTVLGTQLDSATSIRSFAKDLSLFTTTLAGSDADLRRLIDRGGATATELRTFLEDNRVELAGLLNNLVTTGEVVVKRLDGLEQVLVVYPYVVEGGYTVVAKDPQTGKYDAHFGLVLTTKPPLCKRGYEGTDRRPPQEGENRPMATGARCAEPASVSNPRGSQNAPRAGAAYRSPVVGMYDPATENLKWVNEVPAAQRSMDTPAPRTFGEESWKWLFLQPLAQPKE